MSPLDFELHREIAAQTEIPLATGENLFSCDDARNLLYYAGLRSGRDLLQIASVLQHLHLANGKTLNEKLKAP